ncbi:hypothetical protein SNEBB_005054 [Seison nebaliae]|nr:hypothetical protein SNEBB_005054 [Seison nebaliae]
MDYYLIRVLLFFLFQLFPQRLCDELPKYFMTKICRETITINAEQQSVLLISHPSFYSPFYVFQTYPENLDCWVKVKWNSKLLSEDKRFGVKENEYGLLVAAEYFDVHPEDCKPLFLVDKKGDYVLVSGKTPGRMVSNSQPFFRYCGHNYFGNVAPKFFTLMKRDHIYFHFVTDGSKFNNGEGFQFVLTLARTRRNAECPSKQQIHCESAGVCISQRNLCNRNDQCGDDQASISSVKSDKINCSYSLLQETEKKIMIAGISTFFGCILFTISLCAYNYYKYDMQKGDNKTTNSPTTKKTNFL